MEYSIFCCYHTRSRIRIKKQHGRGRKGGREREGEIEEEMVIETVYYRAVVNSDTCNASH